MSNAFGNLMQDILGAGNGPVPASAQDQFHQVVQQAPPESLSQGLTAAFNSNQTPSFGAMVAHMFGFADPDQKTGIVNRLLTGAGPSAPTLLSQLGLPGGATGRQPISVTQEQASVLSSPQVEQLATQAQAANPGIVGTMSDFYAQHPVLVKTLGAASLSLILGNIGRSNR